MAETVSPVACLGATLSTRVPNVGKSAGGVGRQWDLVGFQRGGRPKRRFRPTLPVFLSFRWQGEA